MTALMGSGLTINVKGNNLDKLQELAGEVAKVVENTEGTVDVDDGLANTTPSFTISVDKEKAAKYGMTVAQVFQLVYGEMASSTSATTISTDINKAAQKILNRKKRGKQFSVVVVAEGAKPIGGDITVKAVRNKGEGVDNNKLGGAGEKVAQQLQELTGLEARCTVLGYMQRGGSPTSFDRVLSTKYGAKAMELALAGKFNVLTVIKDGKLNSVPLEDSSDLTQKTV
jgi:6-phosphofructokinase